MRLIWLCILFLFSCNAVSKFVDETDPPADISSEQDRQDIELVKSEIQNLADQIGVTGNFKDFPVIVVEQFTEHPGALGYCHQGQNLSQSYIGILKKTMDMYLFEQRKNNDTSFLFKLLLHEYGHCLFNRTHDETMIGKPGFDIFMIVSTAFEEKLEPIGPQISVSAMASINWRMTRLPRELKKYYLREISGMVRWQTSKDLEVQPGLKLMSSEPYF